MNDEVHIRPYDESDLEALLELRASCFDGFRLERERVRRAWAFAQHPARVAGVPTAWVAEMNGRLVGTYGLMPARLHHAGERVPALCGVDFCVLGELRGRGLGRRLTEAFVGTAGSNLRFITSPTATTTALMRERGAGVVDGAQERALHARAAPFDGSVAAAPRELVAHQVTEFGAEFDALSERVARHHTTTTVRDAVHLGWRYTSDPFVEHVALRVDDPSGTLRGFAVLTLSPIAPQGYLSEFSVEPHDVGAARALLAGVLNNASGRNLDALFAFERRPALQALLAECGFATISSGAPEPVLLALDGTSDTAGWLLTPGDGDFLFRIGDGA